VEKRVESGRLSIRACCKEGFVRRRDFGVRDEYSMGITSSRITIKLGDPGYKSDRNQKVIRIWVALFESV